MATIPFQAPIANVASGQLGPSIFTAKAGSHINDADFVIFSGNNVVTSAANPAAGTVVGIAQHDSYAVFQQIDTDLQGVFGTTQVDTALFPADPAEMIIVTLGAGVIVKMNLPTTTGWITGGTNQAHLGTSVGLGIDGTTGFFFADDQASNKLGTIVGKLEGPGFGVAGDLAAIVYVSFIPSDLAIVTGH